MRIDLKSGAGSIDVVFDGRYNLDGGELVPYDGSDAFHARFGGRTYYASRSGASYAGWIPGHAGVARVSTYRVDTYRPQLGGLDGRVVFGHRLLVPVSYRDRGVAYDWPVLDLTEVGPREEGNRGFGSFWGGPEHNFTPWPTGCLREDLLAGGGQETLGKIRFISPFEVNDLLTGAPVQFDRRQITFRVLDVVELQPVELEVSVDVNVTGLAWHGHASRQAIRQILRELLFPVFGLSTPLTWPPPHMVGMRIKGEYVYKVRRSLPVEAVLISELSGPDGVEKLNSLLPDGFRALTTDVVVGNGLVLGPNGTKPIEPQQELRLLQGIDGPQVAADILGLPADRPKWNLAEWLAARARSERRSSEAPTPAASAASADDEPLADWERELLESDTAGKAKPRTV